MSFVFSHLKILWATMALTEQQLREDPMILYWISGRGWMDVFANPTENLCKASSSILHFSLLHIKLLNKITDKCVKIICNVRFLAFLKKMKWLHGIILI